MVRQTPGHPVVSISERPRLSSGHHAYGSVARPLGLSSRPLSALPVPYRELQSLDNVFLKVIPESTRKEVSFVNHLAFQVRTCVFALLKTVRLDGGLHECPLKLKLRELS